MHVLLPFQWWKHHRFCVTAAKNTTTSSQAAFSPFLTLVGNNLCVLDGKWQRSRQYPAKTRGCVLSVMTNRGGIFSPSLRPPPSLLIPFCPNDANKIWIHLTHLVLSTARLLSFFKRPKWLHMAEMVVFLEVREYRCWERLRGRERRCVAGWAEWSRASAWGHTLVPDRII